MGSVSFVVYLPDFRSLCFLTKIILFADPPLRFHYFCLQVFDFEIRTEEEVSGIFG